ncbi:hypothetical protein LSAT2_009213 [Lamellibrachia satsuma]|nr:hypothetical protein LSAT2_009213 [Lamellibrachia satsuma]
MYSSTCHMEGWKYGDNHQSWHQFPEFIVTLPTNNTSDSEDEEEDVYGGYQLLPQDPESHAISSETSGTTVTAGGDVGTPDLDDVIISVLDANDCQHTFATPYVQVERGSSCGAARGTSTSVCNETPHIKENIVEPMDPDQAERVKAAMKGFVLPMANMPHWASVIPEDEWKSQLLADVPSRGRNDTGSCSKTDVVDKT